MSFTINKELFSGAIRFAEGKHGYYLDKDLLRSLILKIADKKDGISFEEAVRFSLNELHLYDGSDKPSRTLYKCGAAKYYSLVSTVARKARSKNRKKEIQKTNGRNVQQHSKRIEMDSTPLTYSLDIRKEATVNKSDNLLCGTARIQCPNAVGPEGTSILVTHEGDIPARTLQQLFVRLRDNGISVAVRANAQANLFTIRQEIDGVPYKSVITAAKRLEVCLKQTGIPTIFSICPPGHIESMLDDTCHKKTQHTEGIDATCCLRPLLTGGL